MLDLSDKWFTDYENVTTLGGKLEAAGFTAAQLQRYYEKPWKWTPEWEASRISQDALEGVLNGEKTEEPKPSVDPASEAHKPGGIREHLHDMFG